MKNLKIGARLTAGYAVLLLMLGIIAVTSYLNVHRLNGEINYLVTDKWAKSRLMHELNTDLTKVSVIVREMVIADDAQARKSSSETLARISGEISQLLDKMDKMVSSETGKRHMAAIRQARESYRALLADFQALLNAGRHKEASALMLGDLAQQKQLYVTAVNEMMAFQDKEVERVGKECEALAERANKVTLAVGMIALLFGTLIARYISRSITRPIERCVLAAEKIAEGDTAVSLETTARDETGVLLESMTKMTNAIQDMVCDATMLTTAAAEGKLATRADASRHRGDFRRIIDGFNATLDAVIGPLNVAADYVDRISRGDIPPRITDSYNGDFNEFKDNLNQCIDAVNALVSDANMLSAAAVEGRLATRADAGRHHGHFRMIVQGVNDTLDSVILPIDEVRAIMEGMARGDLSRRMSGEVRGDFAVLKHSLNNALVNLGTAIGSVTQTARQVASASAQTSGAVGQISDGSQNQLHAIGQVATAIKQTTTSIVDVSRHTEDASRRAKDSLDIVNHGLTKMVQMVEVVNTIAANSEKINKITNIIEKVANKTNLLSLNAAIEAARAGEHGRGFAVVADEVGKLAANAAESTQEIVALVNQAVKEAHLAVATVNEVSEGMCRISEGAVETESMLQRIAVALEQQSAAAQEVNANIISLNKVAESNAAASEEITATVVELARLADNTRREAERFQL